MKGNPKPEYYNVEQACDLLNFDRNQLQYAIKQFGITLSIYIDSKINPLSSMFDESDDYFIEKQKLNTIPMNEIERIGALSNKELINEGYIIAPLSNPNEYIVKKNDFSCVIREIEGIKTVSLPEKNPVTVDSNGFVDLCEQSFMNPRHNINSLFKGGIVEVLFVKSKSDGYTYNLNTFCEILLKDIYIYHTELKRIPNFDQKKPSKPRRKEPKQTKRYKNDAIARAVLEQILPIFLPNRKACLEKHKSWSCFTQLKEALIKNGAKKVDFFPDSAKDNATITGIDEHGEEININYKAFNSRLTKLVAVYKQQ